MCYWHGFAVYSSRYCLLFSRSVVCYVTSELVWFIKFRIRHVFHSPTLESPPFWVILSIAGLRSLELENWRKPNSVTGSSLVNRKGKWTRILYVLFSCHYLSRQNDGGLPVLDDPHHWAIHAYIHDLGNLSQEIFLDLKTTLSDAPAAIHEEGDVHFTVCSERYMHIHTPEGTFQPVEQFLT